MHYLVLSSDCGIMGCEMVAICTPDEMLEDYSDVS